MPLRGIPSRDGRGVQPEYFGALQVEAESFGELFEPLIHFSEVVRVDRRVIGYAFPKTVRHAERSTADPVNV